MQAETQAQMQAEAQTRAEGGQDPLSGQLPGQAPGSTGGRVRVYIDSWDPSYGSGLETSDAPTGESSAPVKLDIETPPESWQPLSPPPDLRAPDSVLFVDGVRRIDTNLWVEEADGTLLPGIAASYAAGVVRCDLRGGRADVVSAQVERGLFTPSAHAVGLSCGNTRYEVRRAAVEDPAQLSQAVQPCLQRLEVDVSNRARAGSPSEDDLLVLDGRLRDRSTLPRALGYIKTHHQQYLPADLAAVVRGLRPGQRTPVFLLGTRWQNYTWYLKLPGPAGSPWAGVVRLEASADLTRPDVIRLADLSTITLPRFASTSYKDSRAPQNLTPIAGLERRLRGMLGDQRLLLRSLTAAAAAQHHPAAAAAQHHPAAAAAQHHPAAAAAQHHTASAAQWETASHAEEGHRESGQRDAA
jgi:hypothetical protein